VDEVLGCVRLLAAQHTPSVVYLVNAELDISALAPGIASLNCSLYITTT